MREAARLAESLVSPRTLNYDLHWFQVALNIPPHPRRPGAAPRRAPPEQARPDSFTMLAGIYLVDETATDSGNLWMWPGSHLVHERLFRELGPAALLATSGHTHSLPSPPRYSEPVQVLARRGDLLLAYFLLGHTSAATPATGPAGSSTTG